MVLEILKTAKPRRGGANNETKSAVSEAQVRDNAETYIREIAERRRSAAKSKTKANN